ncbi:MAG: hypothetical protein WC503_02950 [Candidatus Shapirobacteria bacterium]
MKSGAGKKKGGAWEREVSRYLTAWASGQIKDMWYWRSPGSGSVATMSKHMNISGDIVSLTPEADVLTNLFSIEIKVGYKETDFFQYFRKCKFNLESFWAQCCRDAKKSNKEPLLIYKKPPILVGIGGFLKIEIPHMTIQFNNLEDLHLYEFTKFFEVVTFESLKAL